ncbi:intermembrane phospholipid transport protein YdbH family protein [Alteraurantiacibacter buctensis]|uniref:Exoprotein n=1 Tax=Alteraurantiacibacter buctensis TaxID=1503981 RepID=A0A844YX15_9SPHN|nr:YdbH domain-containing protein [Alteraurantiacibacter buctensis]MXO71510.1 exoprotein [Alteraurantiacibacter buctensis]
MSSEEPADQEQPAPRRSLPRGLRLLGRGLLAFALLVGVLVAVLWFQRERLVGNYLDDLLAQQGVEATYRIEQIAPDRQVLRQIVVGDPAAPDLTIDRAEVRLVTRIGMPQLERITLSGVRLWGRVVGGKPSFGALDPLIFTESTEPFALPEIDLRLRDARALIEGDYGPVAVRIDGGGYLPSGFEAQVAAVAPALQVAGCRASETTLYGRVETANRRPGFAGPLRFASLRCPEGGVALGAGGSALDLIADADLSGGRAEFELTAGAAVLPGAEAAGLAGRGTATYRGGEIDSRFTLQGRAVEAGGVRLASAGFAGTFRSADAFARLELAGEISGAGLRLGPALDDQLAGLASASDGTLARPLLVQLRAALARELRGGEISGDIRVQWESGRTSLALPMARVTGAGGVPLAQVARLRASFDADGLPVVRGNFLTGGPGLPRISGRMDRQGSGALDLTLAMAPYSAGDATLALPRLTLRQAANGALAFAGEMQASGALPGGFVRDLSVPLNGAVSSSGAVTLWNGCTPVRFAAFSYAGLVADGESLTLCPPRGRPILAWESGGLRVAAGTPALRLSGKLGDTPLRLTTGAVGLAYPGALVANEVDLQLGAVNVAMTTFNGTIDDSVSGRFIGGRSTLGEVPLAISNAEGQLTFAEGILRLADTAFTISDRAPEPRFNPLQSDDAQLVLADSRLSGDFLLRHPGSGQQVVQVDLAHDLSSGVGRADLSVAGLTFGEGFQPADLTVLLYGPVSNVRGTVTGSGVVNWSGVGVTSSTGTFTSQGLDLAAAFGPVRGARGTIEFSDLIGLTTASGQRIRVASINPGIEVLDGDLGISLSGGTLLRLEDATWPFLGGTIRMRPVAINIGASEVRRYEIEITGLEAQRFIEHMDLSNIAATGTFDGTLPIVFDAEGNGRLEGGNLLSRPPGGRLSYVGELTYEDLSPIANYAFDALRDMEWQRMTIDMNGPLTGELVTSVRFDGVRQGPDAERNFITRRLANLPIRFIVNVRAPFYSLVGSLRSLYDPSAVRDPRGLGLLSDDGRRFVPAGPLAVPPSQPIIQPPESEAMP